MFSRALLFKYSPHFHLHAFDVKLSLVQSFFFFLWVILNSTSLQSLWCVTNFPPFNLPHRFLLKSHPSTWQSLLPYSPLSLFLLWHLLPFFWAGPLLLISPLSLSLSPFLSQPQILLSLCLSLRLKTFQFSCHKLCSPAQLSKQGGVPFIPPHILRKEMGGRRALTLVFGHKQLSLIIVFLFSFPVPMEVWRDEHAIIRSSRPESAGLRSPGSVLGLCGFHLNVSQELIQTWSDGRINPWDPAFNGLS